MKHRHGSPFYKITPKILGSVSKRRLRIVFGFVAVLIVLTTNEETYPMQSQTKPRSEGSIQERFGVPGYLYKMAEKLNFHYTYEFVDYVSPTLIKSTEPLDPHVASIDDLVNELKDKLIDVTVVLDSTDKKHPVIHLIDPALAKRDDYIMDKKTNLKYTGVVGNIVVELEKKIPEIGPRRSVGASGFVIATDLITKVKVNAKDDTIRHILTRAVDLDHCGRLIWISKTSRKKDGSFYTSVVYYSHIEPSKQR